MPMSAMRIGFAAAAVLAAAPAGAQAALGPDAAACRAGSDRPAVLVNVDGFKQRTGNLRVQLYSGNPSEFLARGKWLRRIDLPVTASGPMRVCVAVPEAGRYAIAVRHDLDGSGSSGWNDGGGFSRNPRLALPNPRPRHQDVVFAVGSGVQPINVVLNYRFGLSIRPVQG
jgi:uncharacterized protein (DUF2141 family)